MLSLHLLEVSVTLQPMPLHSLLNVTLRDATLHIVHIPGFGHSNSYISLHVLLDTFVRACPIEAFVGFFDGIDLTLVQLSDNPNYLILCELLRRRTLLKGGLRCDGVAHEVFYYLTKVQIGRVCKV